MQRSTLGLQIGGTTYRVNATAPDSELQRLAAAVDAKLREINPQNRPVTPQTFLLVALAFAHEAEEERARRVAVEDEAREMLSNVVARIGAALGDATDDEPEGHTAPSDDDVHASNDAQPTRDTRDARSQHPSRNEREGRDHRDTTRRPEASPQ